MASDKIQATTDSDFKRDVLESETPVLVDFWATWCGPCRAMTPHLEAIQTELEGKLRIVKLNVEKNEETTVTYGINNLPTLLLFKNGKVVDKIVGNPGTKAKIKTLVEAGLAK